MLVAHPKTPKAGWECVDVIDLGEDDCSFDRDGMQLCEWCARQWIRYVHVLQHVHWPDPVEVGCVCASYMQNDDEGPAARERALRRRSRRKRKFVKEPWEQVSRDTWGVEVDDAFFLVRLGRDSVWRGSIVDRRSPGAPPRHIRGRLDFRDVDQLKRIMFDYAFPKRSIL